MFENILKFLKNSPERNLALILGVIILSLGLVFITLAWTEPSSGPPGGNVSAPINVSGSSQVKSGKVGVAADGYDPNYGLTVGNSSNNLGLKASGNSLFESDLTADRLCLDEGEGCKNTWSDITGSDRYLPDDPATSNVNVNNYNLENARKLDFSSGIGSHPTEDGVAYRYSGQAYLAVDDNLYVRDTNGGGIRFHFNTNNGNLQMDGDLRVDGGNIYDPGGDLNIEGEDDVQIHLDRNNNDGNRYFAVRDSGGTWRFLVYENGQVRVRNWLDMTGGDVRSVNDLYFDNGSRIGDWSGWMRIYSDLNDRIYTPDLFRADRGFQVDGHQVISGAADKIYANPANNSGGGIEVSDDGGFYDYNNGWIDYRGTYGLRILEHNGSWGNNSLRADKLCLRNDCIDSWSDTGAGDGYLPDDPATSDVDMQGHSIREIRNLYGDGNRDIYFYDRPRSQDGLYIQSGTAYFNGEIRTDVIQDRGGGNDIRLDSHLNVNDHHLKDVNNIEVNNIYDGDGGGRIEVYDTIDMNNRDIIDANRVSADCFYDYQEGNCITGGGGTDDQTLSVDSWNIDDEITIENGNTVSIDDDYEADTNADTECSGSDTYLSGAGTCETDQTGDGGGSLDCTAVEEKIGWYTQKNVMCPSSAYERTGCYGSGDDLKMKPIGTFIEGCRFDNPNASSPNIYVECCRIQ